MMQTIDRSKTQVKSTAGTYEHIANYISCLNQTGQPVRVLDYGAGLCHGTEILNDYESNDIDAWSFEPFAKDGVSPDFRNEEEITGEFDVVVSNCVLNVIEDDEERRTVIRSMLKHLKVGGYAIIMVRSKSAVKGNKTNKPFADGFVNIKGTFQKGFSKQELMNLVMFAGKPVPSMSFNVNYTTMGDVGVIVHRNA
jgi:SAM-dependent methyltransferase